MNNTTTGDELLWNEHIAVRVVRLVLYPSVFIIGVIGNISVCGLILCAKTKKFRSSKGYFILNLALSDLLVLFMYLPFDLAYLENYFVWPFGLVLCKLISVTSSLSVTVSGSMLICIGYERYKSIVLGKTLGRRLSKKKALAMVAFSWIYSCLLQVPFVYALTIEANGGCKIDVDWWPNELTFNLTYIMALIAPQFVIPALCLIVFYVGIVFHLRKAHKLNTKQGIYTSVNVAEKREQQNRKTTKLLTGLVLVYAFCILPNKLILLNILINRKVLSSSLTRELYEFTRLLTTANSCLNPILYTALSCSFRMDLKRMLSRSRSDASSSFSNKYLRTSRETSRSQRKSNALNYHVRLEEAIEKLTSGQIESLKESRV